MPAGGYSRPWTEAEDDYVKANFAIKPTAQIGTDLGRSASGVRQRGERFGLVSYQRIGTASIRHDYFSRIDTHAKAYVLGLLAADGCMTRLGQLRLDLTTKDRVAVEFVRDEIAPAARLKDYQPARGNPMTRFTIQSPQIAADLARHGVTPAKSYTLPWPSELPEEYANSFVGGYFDGDGSLNPDPVMPRWTIVCASSPFLEAIQQRAFNQTGTWIGGPYRDRRHAALSIVATGVGQVRDLDEWIRADVPGLARKRLPQDHVPVEPERSVR